MRYSAQRYFLYFGLRNCGSKRLRNFPRAVQLVTVLGKTLSHGWLAIPCSGALKGAHSRVGPDLDCRSILYLDFHMPFNFSKPIFLTIKYGLDNI